MRTLEAIEPRADVAQLAPAFGVYVHIPFCISRCPYCDFNTYVGIEDSAPAYVDALLREAEQWGRRAAPREAGSVFVGGGTPSLLDPPHLRRLLDGLASAFRIAAGAEITMEANPETVTVSHLAAFREAGVNRLSFGAQSFAPDVLKTLGRAHTASRTRSAVGEARAAGFDNLNLDLIYGTPGETLEDWRATIEETLALDPEHVSAYALTIEPGTQFGAEVASARMPAPDDDDQAVKYELALDLLANAEYEHYEISNWAKPGRACRHNLVYWTQGEYAGLGAGAHAHLDGVRSWNQKLPRVYTDRVPDAVAGGETLPEAERAEEWLQLRLRLIGGLPIAETESRLGADLYEPIARLAADGLVIRDGDRMVLTRRGLLLESAVLLALSPFEC